MERRDFLKNSLFGLLSVALTSNKSLATIVETLTPDSPKVLLYLIQTIKGEWKVKATKWIDLPNKRLIPSEVKPETFKVLEIVDIEQVNKRRLELWKEYNCVGRMGHLISMGIPMNNETKEEYAIYAIKNHSGLKRNNETKIKISIKAKGRIGHRKGIVVSQETKNKMSESRKGMTLTYEHKKNIGKSVSGQKNGFYGKKHTEDTIKIILEKHPSKIKLTCEHCNKTLDFPNFKRYHGDKCKNKHNHNNLV